MVRFNQSDKRPRFLNASSHTFGVNLLVTEVRRLPNESYYEASLLHFFLKRPTKRVRLMFLSPAELGNLHSSEARKNN